MKKAPLIASGIDLSIYPTILDVTQGHILSGYSISHERTGMSSALKCMVTIGIPPLERHFSHLYINITIAFLEIETFVYFGVGFLID